MSCARLVIGGTQSGTGKTSLALGLVRALSRRGMRVQPYKVGPDFLDPSYLSLAAGRPCYNLDGWMMGEAYVRWLFADSSSSADIAVIEGVMGLFDGADDSTLEGSTAEIASWLNAPVLLVVNVHGMARSLAAVVKGFCEFDKGVRIAGVLANHSGTERHVQWLKGALSSAALPALAGAIPRGALPNLPSRHLGLVTASKATLTLRTLDALADAIEKHVDVEALIRLAKEAGPSGTATAVAPDWARGDKPPTRLNLALARDDAFHFYYPDNLRALQGAGCNVLEFSPLKDRALPRGTQAVYFGGGYPEEHAAALADNVSMRRSVREFALHDGAIYAECGGLMYLGQKTQTLDEKNYELAAVLPAHTRMLNRRKMLGYVQATLAQHSFLGAEGAECRGHEFHYSELIDEPSEKQGWRRAYRLKYRGKAEAVREGFQRERVLASYMHAHFASRPAAVESFVSFCGNKR